MKITYSNSYDREAGYALHMLVDASNITISAFYEHGTTNQDMGVVGDPVAGAEIHEAWSGKLMQPFSSLVLDLDEVKNSTAWADRSVWTGSGRFRPDLMLPAAKHTKLWHNITAETVVNKVRPTDHFMRHMRTTPIDMGAFLLYVPFRDSNFDECAFHILSRIEGIPHIVNGVPLTGPETNPMEAQLSFMPRLKITGPGQISAGDYATIAIALTDATGNPIARNCEVFLEAVSGYLPKTRIPLVNGHATAKVMALGLDAGDVLKVKAGFKFWSGDDEHIFGVV